MSKNKFKIDNFADHYFADFETTSVENFDIENEVRVFMWRVEDIYGNGKEGTTMSGFINYMVRLSQIREIFVWFHNLKFDFSFIESTLLSQSIAQYKRKIDRFDAKVTFGREYAVTRDGMGNTYGSDWYTGLQSVVKFRDSAKIFPMTLKRMGKMVKIDKLDETYDYEVFRPKNYKPTEEEWEYLKHDTLILRKGMTQHFMANPTEKIRMTRSSYAFAGLYKNYNDEYTPKNWSAIKEERGYSKSLKYFDYCFPKTDPELYRELHPAYAGGIVYVNPKYRNKTVEEVVAYDVNSEYPAAMQRYDFPIGHEEEFEGWYYDNDEDTLSLYPLFVQFFTCDFEIKKDGFPMLPKKYSKDRRTVRSSKQLFGTKTMALSNMDMEHFFKNYDVDNIVFKGGYMWQSMYAPFRGYIDAQAKIKIQAEESGDMILREMSKLNINGCYGKFAQSPFRDTKEPYIDDKGVLRYNEAHDDPEAMNYLPMAIFITAGARDILLNGIYDAGVDRVLYVDTDSMHLLGYVKPDNLPVHPTKFGYWSEDDGYNGTGRFERAKFLRDKFYAKSFTDDDGHENLVIKGAGITETSKNNIKTMDEFKLAEYYEGNLQNRMVKGGSLLRNMVKYVKPDRNIATPDEIERDDEHLRTYKQRAKEIEKQKIRETEALRKSLSEAGLLEDDE